MPKFWHKRLLLAKLETTYGVDPAPTGSDAILIRDATVAVEAETIDRQLVRGTLGQSSSIRHGQRVRLTGQVELAGAGTVDTPPKWAPLLRGCGCSQTIVATTRVDYKPDSTTHPSLTFYWSVDGIRHVITGARGTARLRVSTGEIPYLEIDYLGLYAGPTDTSPPTPTYTGWLTPRVGSAAATPTVQINGVEIPARSVVVDLGNDLVYRDLLNDAGASVLITRRNPSVDMVIETPAVATLNPFTLADNHTQGVFQIIHGTVAGQIVQVAGNYAQVVDAEYQAEDGIAYTRVRLGLRESAGNDDVTITTR